MELLINDQISPEKWGNFISENPFSSPFQSESFFNLFNSVDGLSAEAVAVADKGRILALSVIALMQEPGIIGYFSKRGIIFGGPLIHPQYPEALEVLLEYLNTSFAKRMIYLETRNLNDYSNLKGIFSQHKWDYVPYYNYLVNTSDRSLLMKKMSKTRIRQIKKSLQSGVSWEEAKNGDEVMIFYKILKELYQRKIRKPLLPERFFVKFHERNLGRILLVRYNNRIIGGIMCPVHMGKIIYEFYICGLDKEFREQYPSIMATWAAIDYANLNSIGLFDFMGAGRPETDYGVREFKARFGGTLVEYGRFLRKNKPVLYKIGSAGISLMQKNRI